MNEKIFEEILDELKNIKKILLLSVIKGNSQTDNIEILSNFGYKPKEISEILGTTSNTVRVTLNRINKENKNK